MRAPNGGLGPIFWNSRLFWQLMTAAMTHASAVACADLLNDLKSGYLLGADPRRQWIAQSIGIVAGTAASVLAYSILVPDASALLGVGGRPPAFAAPAAHQFRAIAELLQHGLERLGSFDRALAVLGLSAGVALALIGWLVPRARVRWAPSAAGLGLGLLLPASTSLAMLLGATVAALVDRRDHGVSPAYPAGNPFEVGSERVVWPISAGLLAGESHIGVAVALVNQLAL